MAVEGEVNNILNFDFSPKRICYDENETTWSPIDTIEIANLAN